MAAKYEFYDAGGSADDLFQDTEWKAQTFTPAIAHKITSIKLYLCREANPGDITVSIRNTLAGEPTGGDLVAGITDGDTLDPWNAYQWREISLGAGIDLAAGVKYAIVMRCQFGGANGAYWRVDSAGATYPGGDHGVSFDSGDSWTMTDGKDGYFEEWGEPLGVFVPRPSGSTGGILIV